MAAGTFNAASYFIDRHVDEGRGAAASIECGDRRISYQQLHDEVHRGQTEWTPTGAAGEAANPVR